MRFSRWMWLFPLATLAAASVAEGTGREISLTRRFGVGARAMGMGGASVALVDDGSALFLNPAGLARVRRIELAGALKHQTFGLDTRYEGDPADLSEGSSVATRLGSLTGVYPFPTYRGSLVIAGGVDRIFSSDMEFAYAGTSGEGPFSEQETYSVTGGVSAWGVGAAMDISPNASLGVTFLVWDGHDDVVNNYDCVSCDPDTFDYEDLLGTDYSAVSAIVGLQLRLSPWLGLGASVESPVNFTLEGTRTLYRESYIQYGLFEDKVRLPFSFVWGAAARIGGLTLAGDMRYTDWRQLEYEGVLRAEGEFEYQATTEVHVGAEYLLALYPVRLRAGYYTEPLAYRAPEVEEDRAFYTAGAGLLVDDVLAIDVALTFGRLKWAQPLICFEEVGGTTCTEIYRDESFSRMFLSAAYRF